MKKLLYFFAVVYGMVYIMLYVITAINILFIIQYCLSPERPKIVEGEDDMLGIVVDAVAEGDGSGFGNSG